MSSKLTKHEADILFSDFADSNIEFDREIIEKYSENIRGSVRLATGRYYTQKEMRERASSAFSVKLY